MWILYRNGKYVGMTPSLEIVGSVMLRQKEAIKRAVESFIWISFEKFNLGAQKESLGLMQLVCTHQMISSFHLRHHKHNTLQYYLNTYNHTWYLSFPQQLKMIKNTQQVLWKWPWINKNLYIFSRNVYTWLHFLPRTLSMASVTSIKSVHSICSYLGRLL